MLPQQRISMTREGRLIVLCRRTQFSLPDIFFFFFFWLLFWGWSCLFVCSVFLFVCLLVCLFFVYTCVFVRTLWYLCVYNSCFVLFRYCLCAYGLECLRKGTQVCVLCVYVCFLSVCLFLFSYWKLLLIFREKSFTATPITATENYNLDFRQYKNNSSCVIILKQWFVAINCNTITYAHCYRQLFS